MTRTIFELYLFIVVTHLHVYSEFRLEMSMNDGDNERKPTIHFMARHKNISSMWKSLVTRNSYKIWKAYFLLFLSYDQCYNVNCYFLFSGLVKELGNHQMEYANKYLTSHETYVLVKKELIPDSASVDSGSTPRSNYQYKPLLDKFEELFPNYRLHVDHIPTKVPKKRAGKSPSPAGRFSTKSKKTTETVTKSRPSGKRK